MFKYKVDRDNDPVFNEILSGQNKGQQVKGKHVSLFFFTHLKENV
jgi:hypothetical protein